MKKMGSVTKIILANSYILLIHNFTWAIYIKLKQKNKKTKKPKTSAAGQKSRELSTGGFWLNCT